MKKITNSVYYTGVMNPNLRVFDVIMRTDNGTSYNSYLVRGSEKNALIEASHNSFFDNYLENIKEALNGEKADYLVLNHCEPDHTGCVARLLEVYPDLTIVVSQAGSNFIKNIVNMDNLKIQVVKDGDSINLGDKTLQFINAPFLHWPDSMFTWIPQEKTLFSCDFLGSHYCEPEIFDTRIKYENSYFAAAKYYYDCIFSPFKPYVLKGLEKISDIDIEYVCNSHGPILTKKGKIHAIIEKYREWSTPVHHKTKMIPIFYCTAYGNTERLATAIQRGILSVHADAEVKLFNIIEHEIAELQALMNESDAFLVGSPTINRDAVPPVWQLLAGIEAVNIGKRPVALFGSFGWSGEALPNIAGRLNSLKLSVFEQQLKTTFVPTGKDIDAATSFGADFAKTL